MTTTSKFLIASFVTVLTVILLSGVYLAIGAIVFGPKIEVGEACSSIAGRSFPAATAIVEQYDDMDFMATDSDDWVQVSKVSGGWICFCYAQLANGDSDVLEVTDVSCSD
ncbi:MAG: hypothetical protein AAFY26_06175 [Cyanobacteria bacterium J06638_22]